MTDGVRTRLLELTSLGGLAPAFEVSRAPESPGALFEQWFGEAADAGIEEPHAMTLSTITAEGTPDARVLILKDFEPSGRWAFSSSAESAKGRQLEDRPVAALTFYWPRLVRTVRVRGRVAADSQSASRDDYITRSDTARAIVVAGGQSAPAPDPSRLREEIAAARARIEQQPDLGAEHRRKYWVTANTVEFWQGEQSRQHSRLQFQREAGGWTRRPLRP